MRLRKFQTKAPIFCFPTKPLGIIFLRSVAVHIMDQTCIGHCESNVKVPIATKRNTKPENQASNHEHALISKRSKYRTHGASGSAKTSTLQDKYGMPELEKILQ